MTITDFERRFFDYIPGIMGIKAHYAVLVPLVEWRGELSLLLEVRAETLNRQPGEVCFPGGKMEAGEGPTECAFRETFEELGIPADTIRPIARLDEMVNPSGFLMHPVLAQVDPAAVETMRISTAEVKEAFLVPLSFLRESPPVVYTYALEPQVGDDFPYDLIGFEEGYHWRGGRVEVPIWNYQGRAIWGLTARIIRWLLERVES